VETLAFVNPALLWGALAVSVPVAIHLLSRRRSRRVPFAAIDFILKSRREKVSHVKLRQLLLLLLRAGLLLFLAIALARPMFAPKAAAATDARAAVGLVLDASLSMRYRDGDSLFEKAREEAIELLRKLPGESPATLVVCDGTTPAAEPPSFDRAGMERRLEAAEPSFRRADVTACLSAAAHALAESTLPGKRLYVLSDLTASAFPPGAPAPVVSTPAGDVVPEVVFVDAAGGEALADLAIVSSSVRASSALGARGYEVEVSVRNSGDEEVKNVPIALEVGDLTVTRGFVDVPAGGLVRKLLAHRFDAGTQRVNVRLGADGLVEDDALPIVLRVPRDVRALVVNGAPSAIRYQDETFFIDAALGPGRTGGRISAQVLDADAASQKSLSEFDVVLLLNVPTPRTPFVGALRGFVEAGGGLFVSMGDQVVADEFSAVMGDLLPRPLHLLRTAAEPALRPAPDERGSGQAQEGRGSGPSPARIGRIDFTHPAFRLFEGASDGFDTARVWRYQLLQSDGADMKVLAELDDGSPLFAEARRGRGRVIFYASTIDRDWTDWPIRTSFLPAIQQLVTYLGGALDDAPPAPATVGDARAIAVPDGVTLDVVNGPDARPVRLRDGLVPVEAPGHYAVSIKETNGIRDAPELAFAATLDPAELDLRRIPVDELTSRFGGESARVAGGADGALPGAATPLWSWVLLAAVIAFVGESLLTRRG